MNPDQASARQFFEALTWPVLKDRVTAAIQHSDQAIPLSIRCPAIKELFDIISQRLIDSAMNKPGKRLEGQEIFNLDQYLAMARILEAMVSLLEDGSLLRAFPSVKMLPPIIQTFDGKILEVDKDGNIP
jgi:hypothetical protein